MIIHRRRIEVDPWGEEYFECWFPGSEEAARRQIPGLVNLLNLSKPVRILDCPCGWGRYSNPLAELGHKLAGFDFTRRFIEVARASAPENNPPDFRVLDMRKLDIDQEYDIILNLYGSFGYYDRDTDFSILASFVKGLTPGGQLMIDQLNREKLVSLPRTVRRKLPNGRLWLTKQSMNPAEGTYHAIDTVRDDAEDRIREFTMNWYSVAEYQAMLEKLRIREVHLHGDFDGSEYSSESKRQIVVATKDR